MENRNLQYVTCALCGREGLKNATPHVVSQHKMTITEYKAMFPGAKIVSEASRVRYSKAKKGIKKSPEHIQKMKDAGTVFGHGQTQPEGHIERIAEINKARDYELASPEKKRKIRDTYLANTTQEQRVEIAIAGFKGLMETKKDGIYSGMNKPEQLIFSYCHEDVEFTGDGNFWVTFKNGKKKNPDFVVQPFSETKKVIECYGRHWHRDDDPQDLIDLYAEVGIECFVVWEDEIEEKAYELIEFISTAKHYTCIVGA